MSLEHLSAELLARLPKEQIVIELMRAQDQLDRLQQQEAEIAALKRQVAELTQENAILLETERSRDAFVAVISHELRTPLNIIMGFASILSDEVDGPLSDRQHAHVDKVLHGADRLLQLINDLLEFSKIQAGRFQLYPKPTPLVPLIQEVVHQTRPDAQARKVNLDTDLQLSVAPYLDGQRIAQVVTHLLTNAIRHSPPGSTVTVRAFAVADTLQVEVSDQGEGLAPEEIPKLFSRTKPRLGEGRAGGLGLGLPLSRSIIKAHGGLIGARSQKGEGSTFWFSLPLTGAVPEEALKPRS